jgi:hypothetical protein
MCSGSLEHCAFKHAPLSHVLYLLDSPSVFVIMFQPDNPVRQMVVDMVNDITKPPISKPQAILCAEASVDLPSRDKDTFEPDLSSEAVVKFFAAYQGTEYPGLADIVPGIQPWLYLNPKGLFYKQGATGLPYLSPEPGASYGQSDVIAPASMSSSEGKAAERAESEDTETSSEADAITGESVQSGESEPPLASLWSLPKRDHDYLYK